jgi:hypothetical protein
MALRNNQKLGILPSLEVLPFFDETFLRCADLHCASYSSYGSIAREMLVGHLTAAVMPWEIFISEIFALPGQRNQWTVAFFSPAGPAELVLQSQLHKNIFCGNGSGKKKFPSKLQIGIESRNSLTSRHLISWLNKNSTAPRPDVCFKFLPMDQRLLGLDADALDGFIARSPWGLVAEERQLGVLVNDFPQKEALQKLVMVFHKSQPNLSVLCGTKAMQCLSESRKRLSQTSYIEGTARLMDACGSPHLPCELLKKAAIAHNISQWSEDLSADISSIHTELEKLNELAFLPQQISATEQTAKLLAHA